MANAPDLPRLTEAFQTVTDQISLFEHLPAVNDQQRAENRHQEIMTQIGNMTAQIGNLTTLVGNLTTQMGGMNTRLNGIDRRLEQIDRRFDQMQNRQTVSEHNSLSRSLNSSANRAICPIFALKTSDNQDIPGFPASVEEALSLTGNQIDDLLRALGQPTTGNVADRKKRFCVHIGLAAYAF